MRSRGGREATLIRSDRRSPCERQPVPAPTTRHTTTASPNSRNRNRTSPQTMPPIPLVPLQQAIPRKGTAATDCDRLRSAMCIPRPFTWRRFTCLWIRPAADVPSICPPDLLKKETGGYPPRSESLRMYLMEETSAGSGPHLDRQHSGRECKAEIALGRQVAGCNGYDRTAGVAAKPRQRCDP